MSIPSYVKKRLGKINAAASFAMQSCEVPFSVYFETFRPAAGKGLITLLSFGLDDVARGYFRPKGVYPRRHLGRKTRKGGSVYLPEFGEEIGKRLTGAEEVKARKFGAYEKSLWILDGVFQRVMFWLMVADVGTDFLYDWMSGIFQQGYCRTSGQGTGLYSAKGPSSRPWESGQAETTPFPQWWDNLGVLGAGKGPNYGWTAPSVAMAVHVLKIINSGPDPITAGWTAQSWWSGNPDATLKQSVQRHTVAGNSELEVTVTLLGYMNQLMLVSNLQQERIHVDNRALNLIPMEATPSP